MRGILIDPKAGTVSETDAYTGDYQQIYTIIGASLFDCVRVDDSETMFVDDEGLLNGNGKENGFFYVIGDNPVVIAGKALILGTNEEGDSVASKLTIDQVKAMVRFGAPVKLFPGTVEFFATDGRSYPVQ